MGAACSSEGSTQTKGNTHQPAAASNGQSAAHYFETIRDKFETVEEVQRELRKAGLESSELIVAIDLTKSNEWSGSRSFQGQCLHSLAAGMNPYKSVISIIAKTLAAFDDDQLIPTYGFGDVQSREKALVSFSPSAAPLHGLDGVVAAYDGAVGTVQLSGPTSFAPAVYKAIEHVRETGGRYHILLIIADGQVSEGACTSQTATAIIEASNYPLSIVMVGVGDGPFDKMREFDDLLTQRLFDNFQFVDYTDLGQRAAQRQYDAQKWEADFALASLMEIPDQYRLIGKLGLLGKTSFARPAPQHVPVTPLGAGASNGAAGAQMPGKHASPQI